MANPTGQTPRDAQHGRRSGGGGYAIRYRDSEWQEAGGRAGTAEDRTAWLSRSSTPARPAGEAGGQVRAWVGRYPLPSALAALAAGFLAARCLASYARGR